MSTPIIRLLFLGIPTLVVGTTSFMVLFGDQGLLELSRTEEQLTEIRLDIDTIKEENRKLEVKIRRLRSSPSQVELLTAERPPDIGRRKDLCCFLRTIVH